MAPQQTQGVMIRPVHAYHYYFIIHSNSIDEDAIFEIFHGNELDPELKKVGRKGAKTTNTNDILKQVLKVSKDLLQSLMGIHIVSCIITIAKWQGYKLSKLFNFKGFQQRVCE